MHVIPGLWRWRGNVLCRTCDRHEAWLALCTALLIALGAPAAGLFAADRVGGNVLETAARERAERRQVWASAEGVVLRAPSDTDPESSADRTYRSRVVARWTGPDGSSHRQLLTRGPGVHAGDRFRIWTDREGHPVSRPATTRTATAYAALAGLAAAVAAALGAEAARRLALRRSLRRRYARWDEEWQRIGPDWGRTGSSN